MTDSTFTPTPLRGHDLLREVMRMIEEDYARAEADGAFDGMKDPENQVNHGRVWNQDSWGELGSPMNMQGLLKKVAQEAVDSGSAIINQHLACGNFPMPPMPPGSCGTTCCVAGHAVLVAGDSPMVYMTAKIDDRSLVGEVKTPVQTFETVRTPDGEVVYISERAQKLMGLTDDQANALFDAYNSISELRQIAAKILEGGRGR